MSVSASVCSVKYQVGSVVRYVDPQQRRLLPLADWELYEALGEALAQRLPAGTQALVASDASHALLHVIGRSAGLPTFVAEKEVGLGVDAQALRGKRVAIVADAVPSAEGPTAALRGLLVAAGAACAGVVCAFVLGEPQPGVTALLTLPSPQAADAPTANATWDQALTAHACGASPRTPVKSAAAPDAARLKDESLFKLDLNSAKRMSLSSGSAQEFARVLPRRRSSLPCCADCGLSKLPDERMSLEGFDSSRYCTCEGF